MIYKATVASILKLAALNVLTHTPLAIRYWTHIKYVSMVKTFNTVS